MNKFSFNKKNKLRVELAEKAQSDVCSWYELYESSSKASGVGLITRENYEIMTSLNSYGCDYSAPIIFGKYFGKDLDQVEAETKMYWADLIPKYYDTIVMNLSSPYKCDVIYFSLPSSINQFQEEILIKIDQEVNKYNNQQVFKLRVSCRVDGKFKEFDTVSQMINEVYRGTSRVKKTPNKN